MRSMIAQMSNAISKTYFVAKGFFLPAARYEHAGLQVIFVFLLGKKVFSGMMKEYKHQNIRNQGP